MMFAAVIANFNWKYWMYNILTEHIKTQILFTVAEIVSDVLKR